jgi:hypothetical protein
LLQVIFTPSDFVVESVHHFGAQALGEDASRSETAQPTFGEAKRNGFQTGSGQ